MTFVTPKRFTITEYHRLIELGFLTESDSLRDGKAERVELIRGELMQMAAKGTRHSVCNTKLYQELYELIKDKAVVRGQEPIIIPHDSEPDPDVVIARGQADDYLPNHPLPEDILLVIEVSDSTLKYDQSTKLELYAEAQISDYWIINLLANQLERYSQPYQDAQGDFGYRIKQIYLSNESVTLPGFPDFYLKLNRVFPGLR